MDLAAIFEGGTRILDMGYWISVAKPKEREAEAILFSKPETCLFKFILIFAKADGEFDFVFLALEHVHHFTSQGRINENKTTFSGSVRYICYGLSTASLQSSQCEENIVLKPDSLIFYKLDIS